MPTTRNFAILTFDDVEVLDCLRQTPRIPQITEPIGCLACLGKKLG